MKVLPHKLFEPGPFNLRQLEELAKAATPPKTAAQLLAEPLQPEGLPPCYGVVLIDPYTRTPLPLVHYWKVGTDGTGGLVPSSEPSCPQG